MKICKRYISLMLLVGVFISILLSTFLTIDSTKTDRSQKDLSSTNIVQERFFCEAKNLPFSDLCYEQSHNFNGFSLQNIHDFKDYFLLRILFHSQLTQKKLDNSTIAFLKNIAQKKLEGYYLYNLRKLLV